MRTVESDICIIGSGITAILTAERLAELTWRDPKWASRLRGALGDRLD